VFFNLLIILWDLLREYVPLYGDCGMKRIESRKIRDYLKLSVVKNRGSVQN